MEQHSTRIIYNTLTVIGFSLHSTLFTLFFLTFIFVNLTPDPPTYTHSVSQCTVYLSAQCISVHSVFQCTVYFSAQCISVQCFSVHSVSQCTVYFSAQCISVHSVSQCTVYLSAQCISVQSVVQYEVCDNCESARGGVCLQ